MGLASAQSFATFCSSDSFAISARKPTMHSRKAIMTPQRYFTKLEAITQASG